MAVGTVSGVTPDDNWQLIATNTPSAASNSSFTSISGYKKLMVAYKLSTISGPPDFLGIRFNSDSTAGNYGSSAVLYDTNAARSADRIIVTGYMDSSNLAGYIIFRNTDKLMPIIVEEGGGRATSENAGVYYPSSLISQIDFAPNTGTITGTIYLYGIAA